jgi:NTP pyrophosphatase (non-canonical NTP hydrolase)
MDIKTLTEELNKVSKTYTAKFKIKPDSDWYILKLQEELGELIQSYLMLTGKARTKGKTPEELSADFHKEVADVFSHVLLLARYHKIDIEKEVKVKWLIYSTSGVG